jgi:ParB family chromosome partitioning protein
LREREGYAARLQAIDIDLKKIIGRLQARGFKSPYLRTYVVARTNPVRFHRQMKCVTTPPMSVRETLTRMAAAARKFDVTSVKPGELALVAALTGEET